MTFMTVINGFVNSSKQNFMKRIILMFFFAFYLITSCACDKDAGKSINQHNNIIDTIGDKMKVRIGTSIFTATLYDNATAAAFKKLLPLTVDMVELNGNEKYVDLSKILPSSASNPGTIQKGDLMLYGSSTLVLFYDAFSTLYNYTRLGRIDDVSGLAAALGSGSVTVKFEMQ